jgi:hypothetical protein
MRRRVAAGAARRAPLDCTGLERRVSAVVRLIDRDRLETHVMAGSELGRMAKGLDGFAELHHQARPIPRVSMLWPGGVIGGSGRTRYAAGA